MEQTQQITQPIDPLKHWESIQDQKMQASQAVARNIKILAEIHQQIADAPKWYRPIACFVLRKILRETEARVKECLQLQTNAVAMEKEARSLVLQLLERAAVQAEGGAIDETH